MTAFNRDRAAWAEAALDGHRRWTGSDEHSMTMRLHDLLCDLRHLADREGADFEAVLGHATETCRSERAEEAPQQPPDPPPEPAPDLSGHVCPPWGSRRLYDARGIYCGRVCDVCEASKRAAFRPEMFTDPNYAHDEPIDAD